MYFKKCFYVKKQNEWEITVYENDQLAKLFTMSNNINVIIVVVDNICNVINLVCECHCEGVKSTVVKPSKLSLVKKYTR